MATLITAAGARRTITPANGRTFQLQELQQLVGGYIEVLRAPEEHWCFLNEEGKLKALPYNAEATALLARYMARDDYLVGDVVICTALEAGETGEDEDE
jgi:Domain of unknown function (DUF3846)